MTAHFGGEMSHEQRFPPAAFTRDVDDVSCLDLYLSLHVDGKLHVFEAQPHQSRNIPNPLRLLHDTAENLRQLRPKARETVETPRRLREVVEGNRDPEDGHAKNKKQVVKSISGERVSSAVEKHNVSPVPAHRFRNVEPATRQHLSHLRQGQRVADVGA